MRPIDRCPVCDGGECRFVLTGGSSRHPEERSTWSLWRCGSCGHGFLNPQPSWEELARHYHEGYQPYRGDHALGEDLGEVVRGARESGEYRHVKITEGMRVLDVGCGGGSFLRVAGEMGAEVAGVEPSRFGAERARSFGLEVFEGSVEAFEASEGRGSFDLVTFNHVLEHVADPVSTLRTAGRLLKAGGMIWVAVPNGGCWLARALGWRWHSADFPVHLMHFSMQSLTGAVERAGLRVHRGYTDCFLEGLEISICDWLRFRLLVPRRVSHAMMSSPAGRRFVRWMGKRMDARGRGEALIVEVTGGSVGGAETSRVAGRNSQEGH